MLPGLIYIVAVVSILAGQYYWGEFVQPRRRAKRSGRKVFVQRARGLQVYHPDGSSTFEPRP